MGKANRCLQRPDQNEGAWRPKWLIPLLGGRVCGGAEEAFGGWTGGRAPVLPLRCVLPSWGVGVFGGVGFGGRGAHGSLDLVEIYEMSLWTYV